MASDLQDPVATTAVLRAPSASTSMRRTSAWTLALLATLCVYGGGYFTALSSHTRVGDFFQEWASARNYFEGLPIYTPQETTAWRYLAYRPSDAPGAIFCRVNGHPPPSVLLGLPLGRLPYPTAFLLWNIASLLMAAAAAGITLRLEFGTVPSWRWLVMLTLLLGNPLLQTVMMGQWTACLLLLVTAAAWAEADDRPGLSGALVGTAAALKLFPGFLFLYFLLQRRWTALFAGAISFVAWHGATFALFGADTYTDWFRESLPEVLRYRDTWLNYSATGFWYKLFEASSGQSVPLWHSPTAARIGSLVSFVAVVMLSGYAVGRSRGDQQASRSAFSLCITAMVLATPIAWDHYFLLLMVPIAHLAATLPQPSVRRLLFNAGLFALWLNPIVFYGIALRKSSPLLSTASLLTIVSWPFYGLIAVFALGLIQTLAAVGLRDRPHALPSDDTMKLPRVTVAG